MRSKPSPSFGTCAVRGKQDPDIKEEILRCLSVPWVGKAATALRIEEFKQAVAGDWLLAWTIGNALSIVDIAGFETEIFALARNSAFGVSALDAMKLLRALPALNQLLGDKSSTIRKEARAAIARSSLNVR
ncbi:MAG TPA: hypothetical protein VKS01_09855 [Bryobacteraceae bacterium]|nr:hypothetical protein [Bryobacteraceae bacterium]